jgi:hypothetical protein
MHLLAPRASLEICTLTAPAAVLKQFSKFDSFITTDRKSYYQPSVIVVVLNDLGLEQKNNAGLPFNEIFKRIAAPKL